MMIISIETVLVTIAFPVLAQCPGTEDPLQTWGWERGRQGRWLHDGGGSKFEERLYIMWF